jgi:hypothetical protein
VYGGMCLCIPSVKHILLHLVCVFLQFSPLCCADCVVFQRRIVIKELERVGLQVLHDEESMKPTITLLIGAPQHILEERAEDLVRCVRERVGDFISIG